MLYSIINDYNDKYGNEILILQRYLDNLHGSEELKLFYSQYKKIIYPSIINRIYVSFEYLIKDLFLMIYRQLDLNNEIDLTYLKIHELPGYIIEDARIIDKKLTLELTDKVVSFTSKNLDIETITKLFSRIKVDPNNIRKSIEAIDFNKYFDVPYQSNSTFEGRLKYFIEHRNAVSHSYFDEYQELTTINLWIEMLREIYQSIFSVVINKCLKRERLQCFKIIHVYCNGKVICFDNIDNLELEVDDSIFIDNQNRIFFYKVTNIVEDGKRIENTKNHQKIGLEIESLSCFNLPIKSTECYIVHKKI